MCVVCVVCVVCVHVCGVCGVIMTCVYVNVLEHQAQWRDKTQGKLVIVNQCVSRQWMDEGARRPRRIGSIKEIGF